MFTFNKLYSIIQLQEMLACNKSECFKTVYHRSKSKFPCKTQGKDAKQSLVTVAFMKITIYGKQMSVRESLKELIEKKLGKFDKFFGENTEAFVTCRTRKGVKILEITINYGTTTFRSEEESETFITALDRAIEGLERQIRKNKTRLEKKVKSGAFVITDAEDDDEYEEEAEFNIRVKTFPFKPMSAEEAILQMNLLGHSFFAFTDAASHKVGVVYKRKDGDYGLIIEE